MNAIGRYQMRPAALQAAGMINEHGNWSRKYGIHSRTQFLADHEAQKKALTDLLQETQRQLRVCHAFDFVGRTMTASVPPSRSRALALLRLLIGRVRKGRVITFSK